MKRIRYIWFLALLTIAATSSAQFDPSSVARVEEGRIIYQLNLSWNQAQKREITRLFDLDSTVWKKLTSNKSEILLDSIPWKVRKISPQLVELSRKIETKPAVHLNKFDVFLTDENYRVPPGYVDQDKVIYGANNFSKSSAYRYEKGIVRFFLPGYLKASHVNIAGSFNTWDPKKTAMQFVDSGWIIKLPLPPGKYFYKFIVDGNWMTDPNNKLSEDDGQGNINSVLFCPNTQFRLKGYLNAKKVIVAGAFNNWNRNEFRMHKISTGWTFSMYLKDGTYSYKFLVDDEWISDPENKNNNTDAKGNKNSVIARGEENIFSLKGYTNAKQVIVAGNFNKWNPNELLMKKTNDGWQLPFNLASGNYEYKFIVDGRWVPDPANPYTTGSGEYLNSCLAFNANHVFTVKGFERAKEVIVTGTFNEWNPEGYHMTKKNGVWTFPIYLPKGKTLYKLIVDGQWITDPGNKLWEQNEYGTGNSVLWIN